MIGLALIIALLYPALADAALIGWWRLNEGTGTTTADSAGGNPGTLVNSPVWTASGKVGAALSFQAADNDHVLLSTTHITTVSNWSMMAWIKLGASSGERNIFTIGDESGVGLSGFSMKLNDDPSTDNPWCQATVGTNSEEPAKSAAAASEGGVWTHIVCVKNGTSLKVYVNAVEQGSITLTTATMDYVGDEVDSRIGSRKATDPRAYTGEIDDVRLYDHALTQLEISAIYSSRRPIAPVFLP